MPDHNAALAQGPTPREPQISTGELSVHLAAGDLAAVSNLRRTARTKLAAWAIAPGRTDDILVVLSELVTNALVHTEGPARVRLECRSGQVLLHVSDINPAVPDLETMPEMEAEGGYGLACIAAALADEITTSPEPSGKGNGNGNGKTVTAAFSIATLS
ncbi:ATP-binding protein [Actinospica robiniae]|uniref:ATP-binding protein n=1 Tax=Actinospica robiniae TaxID=304901 RepID=UPI0003FCFE77|nr:ATP-binding protein [Actinospica robiniae]